MGIHDVLRAIVLAAGCFAVGMSAVLIVGTFRGLRVPHGIRPLLTGIAMASVAAVCESAQRSGQPYTWKTWVYALSFVCIVTGLTRLFFQVSTANRHPATPMVSPRPRPQPSAPLRYHGAGRG